MRPIYEEHAVIKRVRWWWRREMQHAKDTEALTALQNLKARLLPEDLQLILTVNPDVLIGIGLMLSTASTKIYNISSTFTSQSSTFLQHDASGWRCLLPMWGSTVTGVRLHIASDWVPTKLETPDAGRIQTADRKATWA